MADEQTRFSTGLTDETRERLALLSEELAEALQAVTKIERHGFESVNPFQVPGMPRTMEEIHGGETKRPRNNREALSRELGDVLVAVRLLIARGNLDAEAIRDWHNRKLSRVNHWLHFNTTHGIAPIPDPLPVNLAETWHGPLTERKQLSALIAALGVRDAVEAISVVYVMQSIIEHGITGWSELDLAAAEGLACEWEAERNRRRGHGGEQTMSVTDGEGRPEPGI